ncbi:hypothetical protein, partial [Spirulina sp. 06S082]|uniref:hypothetical protein n=1 Tax=Spirulina sp. 06S082 TaxID=3110248 RepID=UPI002B1FFE22
MNISQPRSWYFALSLIAPVCYGLITLHYVSGHEFIVQDDMRHHVVWFQQFIEPQVFQNDAIARYFRSVAPLGFTTVYRFGAWLGLDPLFLGQILPIPLALVATVFIFQTTLAIVPVPLAAWLATLIFNQHLWLNDDLVSATPRAFLYPLFAAFLYYTVRRSLLPMLLSIALLGLFFPQMMLVAMMVLSLQLVQWETPRHLSRDRRLWGFVGSGLLVAIAIAIPFALNLSEYGPSIPAEQMRSQLEYGLGGRNEYFGVNPIQFWLEGSSGLEFPIFPSIIWAGFTLPFLRNWHSATIRAIFPSVRILLDLTVASLILFFLAHLLLFRLYYPSRYTYHSWRFVLSIAAGIVLAALIEKGWNWWQQHRGRGFLPKIALGCSGLLAGVFIGVPLIPPLIIAFQGWVVGETPLLYTYLAQQPPQTIVASLAPEADNIPAFAHRTTWVGREFALPHHPQYYETIADRISQLLQ